MTTVIDFENGDVPGTLNGPDAEGLAPAFGRCHVSATLAGIRGRSLAKAAPDLRVGYNHRHVISFAGKSPIKDLWTRATF